MEKQKHFKHPKIFISHCSKDANIIQNLVDVLDEKLKITVNEEEKGKKKPEEETVKPIKKKNRVFFSSDPTKGIKVGGHLSNTLDTKMSKCNVFIAIITENYVRSLYCIYELSVACFLAARSKKMIILPICSSQKVEKKVENLLKRFDILALYADAKGAVKIIKEALQHYFIDNANLKKLTKFVRSLPHQDKNPGPYIGGNYDYEHILKYCYDTSVKHIATTHADNVTLRKQVSNADEIIIVSTTGDALVRNIKQAITTALQHGAQFKMCMPNQNSEFTLDVSNQEAAKNDQVKNSNAARIAQEFNNTFIYLSEAYKIAKDNCAASKLGSITMYCSSTLLRQTVILARKGNHYWIWCTLTMPSVRVVGGIPSIEYEGNIKTSSTINAIKMYCDNLMEVAKKKHQVISITESTTPRPFKLEKHDAQKEWYKYVALAQSQMILLADEQPKVLIEVSVKNKIKEQSTLNKEFKDKLNLAIDQYRKLKAKKIPASIYAICFDNIAMTNSAKKYLLKNKIPHCAIIDKAITKEYDITNLVSLFKKQKFTKWVSICNPYESIAKTMLCIKHGIIPDCYALPTTGAYLGVVDEIFENIPSIVEHIEVIK